MDTTTNGGAMFHESQQVRYQGRKATIVTLGEPTFGRRSILSQPVTIRYRRGLSVWYAVVDFSDLTGV